MAAAMKILFVFSVVLVVFLLLYGIIRKKVAPKSQVHQRMMGLQSMDASLQREKEHHVLRRDQQDAQRKKIRRLEDTPFMERVVIPAKESIEGFVLQFAPQSILGYIQHKLVVAGKPDASPGIFVFRMALFAAAFGGVMFFAMSQGAERPIVQRIAFLVLGVLVGGILPVSTLNRQIQARQKLIRKQLPEVLDLLCVSVQAGLSFDAALRKIVVRMEGAFITECRKMLDDVRMGMTRRDAMLGLASRCEVQEVSLFVTSIIQAERLGSNMSNTLRVQADNVRERHRQWVKAMALKAPVKIVLPLVGFILPAIFIVALGPALFSIVKNFMK